MLLSPPQSDSGPRSHLVENEHRFELVRESRDLREVFTAMRAHGAKITDMVVLVVAVLLWIDHIAKAGVETGATYALGVNTTVDSVDVGVLTGGVQLIPVIACQSEKVVRPPLKNKQPARID